jgi:regulatory protein
VSVARTICLNLLTARQRTRAELEDALEKRGVPSEAAVVVLNRFAEVGLINDAAYAADFALMRHRERGLARRAIAHQLKEKGVAADLVDAALAPVDVASEREMAYSLVRRKARSMRHLPPDVQRRRLVGMLARKGYGPGISFEAVNEGIRQCVQDESVSTTS